MSRPLGMSQWLAQQLTKEFDKEYGEDYKVVRFILFHIRNGTIEEELQTINVGSEKWQAKELAERIDTIATTHASGLIGRQQYIVKAYHINEINEPCQFPFGKAGETQDLGLGTEGPTQQGLVSQLMRHVEGFAKIMTIHNEQMFQRMNDINEHLMLNQTQLMKENAQAFEVVKELMIEKIKSENEETAKHLEYQRRTQQLQMLTPIAIGLVNKIAGKNILPQGSIADSVLQQLKATLKPEQIEKIAEVLTPEQLAPLMQLLVPEPEEKNGSSNSE